MSELLEVSSDEKALLLELRGFPPAPKVWALLPRLLNLLKGGVRLAVVHLDDNPDVRSVAPRSPRRLASKAAPALQSSQH